jgi:hypothetical protein
MGAGQITLSMVIEEKFVHRCFQYQVFASAMGSSEDQASGRTDRLSF